LTLIWAALKFPEQLDCYLSWLFKAVYAEIVGLFVPDHTRLMIVGTVCFLDCNFQKIKNCWNDLAVDNEAITVQMRIVKKVRL